MILMWFGMKTGYKYISRMRADIPSPVIATPPPVCFDAASIKIAEIFSAYIYNLKNDYEMFI